MNPGLFGLPGGVPPNVRRLKTLGGSSASQVQTTISAFANVAHATPVSAAATPAGVRTRLLGILDRGAIRALSIAGGGTDSTRVEVVVDGVTVWDRTISMVSGTVYSAVGFGGGGASPVFVPDYIPFDSSMELWVTRSALTTTDYAFNVDLHQ